MKISESLSLIVLFSAVTFAAIASAGMAQAAQSAEASATAKEGQLVEIAEKDAAWVAKARKDYPLQVCVVSEEKLGGMGDSLELVYRVEGQPDRLVVFCCDGCSEDFLADPAAHLAKIDAAKKRGASGANGSAKEGAKHE